MQKIIDLNERSQRILSEIRRNLSDLIDLTDTNHDDAKKLKNTIAKLHTELDELEEKSISENNMVHEEITSEKYIMDIKMKKKLTISNRRKSKSFMNWLFNNREL